MSEAIIVTLIICATVLSVLWTVIYVVWRDRVNADSLTRSKNSWKVEEYDRKKRLEITQLEGRH